MTENKTKPENLKNKINDQEDQKNQENQTEQIEEIGGSKTNKNPTKFGDWSNNCKTSDF